MAQKYIRLNCSKCKTINTQMLKANDIVKCPSCLRERTLKSFIDKLKI